MRRKQKRAKKRKCDGMIGQRKFFEVSIWALRGSK